MTLLKKNIYEGYVKRWADVIVAAFALGILSPVMVVLYVLIVFRLGTPVIFSQMRPGLHECPFRMYKFRTMTDARDSNGDLLPDEDRITGFGKWLRSTSLDELPELWNVLKGDMSLIGPRPLLMRYLPFYREEERTRFRVKPGITGLAQVNGRNALTWDERFRLDAVYAENICLLNDIKILFKTVMVVVQKKDILVGHEHVLLDLDVERESMSHGNNQ